MNFTVQSVQNYQLWNSPIHYHEIMQLFCFLFLSKCYFFWNDYDFGLHGFDLAWRCNQTHHIHFLPYLAIIKISFEAVLGPCISVTVNLLSIHSGFCLFVLTATTITMLYTSSQNSCHMNDHVFSIRHLKKKKKEKGQKKKKKPCLNDWQPTLLILYILIHGIWHITWYSRFTSLSS